MDSLNYCVKEKGSIVYAWVLMPNHPDKSGQGIHAIVASQERVQLYQILTDFKKFTAGKIMKEL